MAQYKSQETKKENKGGKAILIPLAKINGIHTKKETGKTSFGFKVADGDEVFYVTGKLVSLNGDRTAFRVWLPEGQVELSKRVKTDNGWETTKLVAECIADLGYPEDK